MVSGVPAAAFGGGGGFLRLLPESGEGIAVDDEKEIQKILHFG